MSADDLWCAWCRQPHAPCATTPAMEAERAATLRARLQERYERPERPCTYDPADEEPEAEPVAPTPEDRLRSHLRALAHESQRADDWTPPRPEPVEYSGLPFTIHPDGSRWGRPRQAPPYSFANDLGWRNRVMDLPPTNTVGGSFPCVCGAILRWEGNPDIVTNEDGTAHRCSEEPQGGPDLINPTDILYPCACGARGIHVCPLATRYPSDMSAAPTEPDPRNDVRGPSKKTWDPTWMDDMPVFRLGTKDKPGGFMTYGEMRKQDSATLPPGTVRAALERGLDGAPHTCPTVEPPGWSDGAEVTTYPCPVCGDMFNACDCDQSAAHLRSYLRTLTNPDTTPEDVNGALDALTPEDRALVSEALPSWGSARMSRVEAIAPFMARFERLVRDRDPRAQEEGTLLLSALREDDPTRSTIEALMEIAKTPKVRE